MDMMICGILLFLSIGSMRVMNQCRQYIAIDLKSFYASVECVERGLDPLDTCLVVADPTRTEKTICLAVSPALKRFGLGGRPRLFEVKETVALVNHSRGHSGKSVSMQEQERHMDMAVDYIVAPPQMAHYLAYSRRIYDIYLHYVAPEDIHVYSVDEVFIDATDYLRLYGLTPHDFAMTLIRQVLAETGVTATAGIGTNLYLCKIAMDIEAKKMKPDKDGVRIAILDEKSYRHKLWTHTPLTDFWRVGHGIAARLAPYGIRTMGDIARCSLDHPDFLYRMFGVNAELLIDHAWGWEPVTMADIKGYRPATRSMSSGQVLMEPYPFQMARTVAMEMADSVALDLLDKGVMTDQIVLHVGYDSQSLADSLTSHRYSGPISVDRYGRKVPTHAHGTANLGRHTSSSSIISAAVAELFDRIVNPDLLVRRLTVVSNHITDEREVMSARQAPRQLSLFTDHDEEQRREQKLREEAAKERRHQEAVLRIKKMFGKNAILKGLNYSDGATQRLRNKQIGGHHE